MPYKYVSPYLKINYYVLCVRQRDIKNLCLSQNFSHLLPVSLTTVINLYFRIYSQIFIKNFNGSNRVFRGMGDSDLWKEIETEISCQISFNASLQCFIRKTHVWMEKPKLGKTYICFWCARLWWPLCLLMLPICDFRVMSGFEPRKLAMTSRGKMYSMSRKFSVRRITLLEFRQLISDNKENHAKFILFMCILEK